MIPQEVLAQEGANAEKIKEKDVKIPNMPIDDFIQESANLIPVCERDRSMLEGVNMDFTLVERIEPAIEVLRDKQTVWQVTTESEESARARWKAEYPLAKELKTDLMASLRFVYYDNPEKWQKLNEIAEGDSYNDTLQDLHDLAFMAREGTDKLKSINYDLSLIDKAEEYSNSLMIVLSKMNGEKDDPGEAKLERDKAYTNLLTIVTEIRRYGKFVNRNNPEKASAYFRIIP